MVEMGTHDYGKDPRPTNPALNAAWSRRCIEGHELCWMHPAEPGREGVQPREDGWLDDRSVDPERNARVAGLRARLDSHADAVAEHIRTGKADRLISEAVALATAWRKFKGETE